jgi:hypothetical protein
VRVGSVDVAFGATLHAVELVVQGSTGHLSAERAEFEAFRLGSEGAGVVASPLDTGPLTIHWGDEFRLTAERASSARLDLIFEDFVVRVEDVALAKLESHDVVFVVRVLWAAGGDVRLVPRQTHAAMAKAAVPMADPPRRETDPGAPSAPPLLDWNLFDGLSGRVDVDLGVVLKLPVLERRAVHEFRVAVDRGTVDFRKLERGLAGLEDSLLDFSVRDGELVLELGVPLLPTRGFGRRLIAWELPAAEQPLANDDRVRLARLAQPRILVGSDSDGDKNASPGQDEDETAPSSSPLLELAFQTWTSTCPFGMCKRT